MIDKIIQKKVPGEDAVKKAYYGMKDKGPEYAAFETAVRVVRFHHPVLTRSQSVELAANIVNR